MQRLTKARRIRRALSLVILLAAWQGVSGYLLPRVAPELVTVLPAPLAVAEVFWGMIERGDIAPHVLGSLKRVVTGFAIAAFCGVSIGLLIGWWRTFGTLLSPIIDFLRPIPPMAWIPIAILWFGIGDTQNVFIIFLGAFFPIALNTVAGIRSVQRPLIWGALTLGGTQSQIARDIVLPGAMPMILTGLRIGLGTGWMALVAAELVAASSGLGYLIEDSRNLLFTERVLIGMILIGLLGYLMDRLMRALQAVLTEGRYASRS